MEAADMFERGGLSQAEIARFVGVSHQTVSDWHDTWEQGGKEALRAAGRAGRLPRATDAQLAEVASVLEKGPRANGYATDLWNLARVAEVIEKVTGVSYSEGHVWRILRDKLGWSHQRPARRAVERDDEAIERWKKERWPRVKKNAKRRGALIVFEDESGFSLLPPVRATWAPKGKTPCTAHHHFNWKRLSMASAIAYEPDASAAELVFQMRPGAFDTEALVEFLGQLHQLLGGRKVTLLWDGLPSHRSRAMKFWLASQRDWLVVEPLPAYGHDLNPVEPVWGNLKAKELANFCPDTIDEAAIAADQGLCRIGTDNNLCFAFLRYTGLKL
jgi:transposase